PADARQVCTRRRHVGRRRDRSAAAQPEFAEQPRARFFARAYPGGPADRRGHRAGGKSIDRSEIHRRHDRALENDARRTDLWLDRDQYHPANPPRPLQPGARPHLPVPYRGSAPAVVDLIAGQIPLASVDLTSAYPHIQAGRLIALGLIDGKRFAAAPEIPTIAESGVPGFGRASGFIGLFAPAGTP